MRRTCEQRHPVEGAVQLAQENVDETVFGELAGVFRALVVHHHLLSAAHVHLRKRTQEHALSTCASQPMMSQTRITAAGKTSCVLKGHVTVYTVESYRLLFS